jgi:hypothetical protein
MTSMFWYATSFNQNIRNWSMTAVKKKGTMFEGASAMQPANKPAGV